MPHTVLIVDDSATMRAIVKTYLAPLGDTLLEATSAEDALAVLRTQAVDAVVCDVWLEGMSGLLLTRELRAEPKWAGLPVVLITMEASPGMEEQARAAGANAFMQKPLKADELRSTLQGLLARR